MRHYDNDTQALRDRKLTYLTPDGEYYSGVNPPEGSEMLGNFYPRVGGLGGCTEHLALVAIAPAKNDWNHIKELTGDNNWDAENMRSCFKRLEKNQYLSAREDITRAHGFGGWLSTTIEPLALFTRDLKMVSIFLSAASSMGTQTDGILNTTRKFIDGMSSFADKVSVHPASVRKGARSLGD